LGMIGYSITVRMTVGYDRL